MRIYITHCSARKNPSLKGSRRKVTSDVLYTSPRIKAFMRRCQQTGVNWAILSDKHGIVFPDQKHGWYEKSPDEVKPTEFHELLENFDRQLRRYSEILFYRPNPVRFHGVYRRILKKTRHHARVKQFSRVDQIMPDGATTKACGWLHQQLKRLPPIRYPFAEEDFPDNGVYFFYEKGESWGHGGRGSRIVRIGTSKEGNFKSRIGDHYLWGDSKMKFGRNGAAPRDRSIFRRNLGRALLWRDQDGYLKLWDTSFTTRVNRRKYGKRRDIRKEKQIEKKVTRLLRRNFSFKFILLEGQARRMGTKGLESRLIGTVARCAYCFPSRNWLGLSSPKEQIKNGKLWLIHHRDSDGIAPLDRQAIRKAISKTRQWLKDEERARFRRSPNGV